MRRLPYLLFPLLWAGCSGDPSPGAHPAAPPVAVTVAPVETIRLDRTLPVVGTLHARDAATVAAEVEGRVERTMAEFGDRVRAGQEIALIDTDSYAALANQAAARVRQARAVAVAAGHELARQVELRRGGIASSSEYDLAVASADQARAGVAAAEAAEAVARLNLDRSRIRAPFDCAVADRVAGAGDFVKSGAPLFRVVNDSVLKFVVQAPENYAPQVAREQPVRFRVDAYPGRVFEGRVFLISPQVNLATRMFDFGALVTNDDRALKAGTFARGELLLERDVPVLAVPAEALVLSSGIGRVFVERDGVVAARTVTPGRVAGALREILAGVAAGERVVTTGHAKLQEGARVRVKP
jgi:membrane fusion protein (multidrug efflux system)